MKETGTIFDLYDPETKEIDYSRSIEKPKQKSPSKRKETGTIFDLYDPQNEEDIQIKELLESQFKPEKKSNVFLDYGKTILKGGIEGISRLGRMISPLQPGAEQAESLEDLLSSPKIDPSESALQQQQEEALNRLLPTEDDFGQRAIRRGLREAPTAMAFPGGGLSMLPRATIAGFLGEGAKDLGAPEWAQTALELTSYLGPDITKKLLAKGSNKDIIEAGRKMGLTDRQITPLIQPDFKQKWLAKITPKRGATQKALGKTKEALGRAYQHLQESPAAQTELPQKDLGDLFGSFYKTFFDMPSKTRSIIQQDFSDLMSKPITGESLINFYKDINANLGKNTKQLARLKEPIKKALSAISPELGTDFEMTNQLYSKYANISTKLKPTLVDDIVRAGEILGLGSSIISGIFTGTFGPLIGILGERAARSTAQHLLFNPRLQQLPQKIIQAANNGKWIAVKKILDVYSREFRKDSPEIANELDKISSEDLEDLFTKS